MQEDRVPLVEGMVADAWAGEGVHGVLASESVPSRHCRVAECNWVQEMPALHRCSSRPVAILLCTIQCQDAPVNNIASAGRVL